MLDWTLLPDVNKTGQRIVRFVGYTTTWASADGATVALKDSGEGWHAWDAQGEQITETDDEDAAPVLFQTAEDAKLFIESVAEAE